MGGSTWGESDPSSDVDGDDRGVLGELSLELRQYHTRADLLCHRVDLGEVVVNPDYIHDPLLLLGAEEPLTLQEKGVVLDPSLLEERLELGMLREVNDLATTTTYEELGIGLLRPLEDHLYIAVVDG